MNRYGVFALLALSAVLVSCGDDGGTKPSTVNLNGTWALTASPGNPPHTVNCSGEVAALQFGFCDLSLPKTGIVMLKAGWRR